MNTSAVITRVTSRRGWDVRVALAFLATWVLWGATFLAIRIAVLEIPPLFAAGVRFFVAGSILYLVLRLTGTAAPTRDQWRSLTVLSLCMFVATYGALFWAMQRVPSGVTAVIEATLPITAMVLEVFVFKKQRFRWSMLNAVLLGFGGIALLLSQGGGSGQSISMLPCLVILASGVAWTLGAVLTRSLPVPQSAPLAAGAEMMLGGAVLIVLAGLTGELYPFPHISLRAAVAVLYLIVGGSLVAFTAYVWLLKRMPATRVASHAYVNPLVAVALGYFMGGEEVTGRMLVASLLVVGSVILILRVPRDPLRAHENEPSVPQNARSVSESK